MNEILTQLRKDLESASQAAKILFESRTIPIEKAGLSRAKMGDKGNGSVYVYYDINGNPIYVGQTKRYVKSRLYDQTSPHKKQTWWESFDSVRFLPMRNDKDTFVLEFLLILAYKPLINLKPGSVDFAILFDGLAGIYES